MRSFYKRFLILFLALAWPAGAAAAAASELDEPVPHIEVQAEPLFTDIPQDHWAMHEIMQLADLGILTGDRDLQFRPETPTTKGEAAFALAKALSLQAESPIHLFNDIEFDSEEELGILAAFEAGLFAPRTPGTFGFSDTVRREQLWDALVVAFDLPNNGRDLLPTIWPNPGTHQPTSVMPSLTIPNIEEFLNNESASVSRASFAKLLHQLLVEHGKLEEVKEYKLAKVTHSNNFVPINEAVHLEKVSFDEHPIYIRATEPIQFNHHQRIDNGFSRDNVYTYSVGQLNATIELTVRSFDNGDEFLFSKVTNPSVKPLTIDVIQKENDVAAFHLYRYDRYPIQRTSNNLFDTDLTSYPTGLLQFMKKDGSVQERMVGQSYVSRQLQLKYDNGGYSFMRELLGEKEALSYAKVGSTLLSVHSLRSKGKDIVDQWYLDADHPLFASKEHMESWMQETAIYYKKRNNWYTASGPYNKMATSTEPMPKTGQGYGRNLLLLKEDRALTLYHKREDRYFENLVYNAFINLKNFKKDQPYWETEVTSTYLQSLYGIHAPFIDTRFNEQIALFYYYSGDEFGIEQSKESLRNNILIE